MQVFYAIPFLLASLCAFELCVAEPRLRPFRYRALVAPVAFGFFSIVAAVGISLIADRLNLGFATEPWSGKRALVLLLIYFVPGLLGSWCAVAAVAKIGIQLKESGVGSHPVEHQGLLTTNQALQKS